MTSVGLVSIVGGMVLTIGCARAAVRVDGRARARDLRAQAWVLPAPIRDAIARRIARSDVALTPEAAIGWYLGGVAAAAWLSFVVAPVLVLPAVVAAVVAGPVALLRRTGRNDRAASSALPGVLDHVVAHLRAGGTVPDALATLAGRPGPLAGDLRRVVARLALGALARGIPGGMERRAAGRRCRHRRGGLGDGDERRRRGLDAAGRSGRLAPCRRGGRGEARALSAQARMSAVVVGAAPLVYLVFSSATDPASVRILVTSNVGRACLVVGLGLEALAAWWMHRLVGKGA